MDIPNENTALDLKSTLVNLAQHRKTERVEGNKPDPLIVLAAYAQDNLVYDDGKIVSISPSSYEEYKRSKPNDLVNKFGAVYADDAPLLLHKKLADVLVDVVIDLRDRRGQFTVVMDALRTFDCASQLQESRPDLVESGLLTHAGDSAHNRALAVDSKLFEPTNANISLSTLLEADEHGHLDDLDMKANSRFYDGDMSYSARHNRLTRLQAWQRASVKRKLPIANLLSEFWDDRVTGSPADMWRIISCRALCMDVNGNPQTNPMIATLKTDLNALHKQNQEKEITRQQFAESAHNLFVDTWQRLFTKQHKLQLSSILGLGAGEPPELADFMFHEWYNDIHDHDLIRAGFPRQTRPKAVTAPTVIRKKDSDPLRLLFEEAKAEREKNMASLKTSA